ncbi:MAG: hypothetical protein KatS3mg109_1650 [Pirellulaceae bacterium]|nr:MAG: hypothetical protein KatS3mg109_1650 [Pirellulaceae bacterium]
MTGLRDFRNESGYQATHSQPMAGTMNESIESTSPSRAVSPVVPEVDYPDVVDLRATSRSAWFSVPLTALAFTSLLAPPLWFAPWVSAVVAARGVWLAHRGPDRWKGGRLSLVMLLVSLFLMAFAPSRYVYSQRLLISTARRHAEAWLELIRQGKLYEAHQLSLEQHERVPPLADLERHYRQRFPDEGERMREMMDIVDPHRMFTKFYGEPPLLQMRQAGQQAQYAYRGAKILPRPENRPAVIVELHYDAVLPTGSVTYRLPLSIQMERTSHLATGENHWHVRFVSERRPPNS